MPIDRYGVLPRAELLQNLGMAPGERPAEEPASAPEPTERPSDDLDASPSREAKE